MGSKERFGPRSFNLKPSLFVPACPRREPSWRSHGGQGHREVGRDSSSRREKGMGKGQLPGLVLNLDGGFLNLTQYSKLKLKGESSKDPCLYSSKYKLDWIE